MNQVIAGLRERLALGTGGPRMIPGGASFAYVFGTVLVMLLVVQAVTGIALAAFYSPSATDAWASVAYLEDQAALGWLVRGLHYHGGSALVVIAGLHLVQTAVAGAYKKPRELVWWLGIVLLLLLLAWAVTGFVLRWDQAGYWANRVEIGIAAGTPLIGPTIQSLALGGNDYGNLTLTRFYTLHVIVLPAVVTLVTVLHIVLARRHGTTPVREGRATSRWPDQVLRDVLAMTVVVAIMLAVVVTEGGIGLAAPADPTQAYDARPLWYFRWLFELRELAGSAEQLAAMAAPAIVGGYLVALPLLDRGPDRSPLRRLPWLGALAGLLAIVGGLTVMSLVRDSGDAELAERQSQASLRAHRARSLAKTYGVPATGAQGIWAMAPMYQARTIYAERCEGCHDAQSKDRKGPVIGPGHKNRAWFKAFLVEPSGDAFWGRTKLARTDAAMKPVELTGTDLEDLVELLYAEGGVADVDEAKRARGATLFESTCTDCHSMDEGVSGSGPGLASTGTRAHYFSFLSNPKSGIHMGPDNSEMPRFDQELTVAERDALAGYLVWLRTATPGDLSALGPL
ncbi:MAG: cytochrome b N-terminal domain-containing protein [Myxococcota bacterium]|nr:cytochrome b N-terminal domain-containing protein [Myxococcota bacterium]